MKTSKRLMNGTPTNRKPRLVVLSAFYEPFMSGAEQMVKYIVENLGDRYDITLFTSRLDKTLPRTEQGSGYKLVRLGFGSTYDKYIYPLCVFFNLWKYKPDIVHAIMESYAGIALFLAKYVTRAPRILTLQSGDLDVPSKQSKKRINLLWRQIHTSPDYVTAISSFLAERAVRLGRDKNTIEVIPNGVAMDEIPIEVEKEEKRVVCVARLSWEKGLDDLIKAWPDVLKEHPTAKLVLVGEGNKRTEIEAMIRDLGIGGSVHLTGNLPHADALKEIKKSTVFICPSLAEGLGNVFIEAQACGVPVIGTEVGGIPDIIEHEVNGLLIAPKNSHDISTAINQLLTDEKLRNALVEQARKSVRKFDWKYILEHIDKVYQKLLV